MKYKKGDIVTIGAKLNGHPFEIGDQVVIVNDEVNVYKVSKADVPYIWMITDDEILEGPKVLIVISGGLVQKVTSTREGVQVIILDHDNLEAEVYQDEEPIDDQQVRESRVDEVVSDEEFEAQIVAELKQYKEEQI